MFRQNKRQTQVIKTNKPEGSSNISMASFLANNQAASQQQDQEMLFGQPLSEFLQNTRVKSPQELREEERSMLAKIHKSLERQKPAFDAAEIGAKGAVINDLFDISERQKFSQTYEMIKKQFHENYKQLTHLLSNDPKYNWLACYKSNSICRALLATLDCAIIERKTLEVEHFLTGRLKNVKLFWDLYAVMWGEDKGENVGIQRGHMTNTLAKAYQLFHTVMNVEVKQIPRNVPSYSIRDQSEYREVLSNPDLQKELQEMGRTIDSMPIIDNVIESYQVGVTLNAFLTSPENILVQMLSARSQSSHNHNIKETKVTLSKLQDKVMKEIYSCKPSSRVTDTVLGMLNSNEEMVKPSTINLKERIEQFTQGKVRALHNVSNDIYWLVLSAAIYEYYQNPQINNHTTKQKPWQHQRTGDKTQHKVTFDDFAISLAGQISIYKNFTHVIPKHVSREDAAKNQRNLEEFNARVAYLKTSFEGVSQPWNNLFNLGLHIKGSNHIVDIQKQQVLFPVCFYGPAAYLRQSTDSQTMVQGSEQTMPGRSTKAKIGVNSHLKPLLSSFWDVTPLSNMVQQMRSEQMIQYVNILAREEKIMHPHETMTVMSKVIANNLGHFICKYK